MVAGWHSGIVFAATRGGNGECSEKTRTEVAKSVWCCGADQFKTPRGAGRATVEFLLFTSTDPKTREDLWILPLDGDRKPFVFLNSDAPELMPQFLGWTLDRVCDESVWGSRCIRAPVFAGFAIARHQRRRPVDDLGERRLASNVER